VRIKNYAVQAKTVMQNNQRTKNVLEIEVTKAKIPDINLFVDQNNYEIIKEFKYTLKVKTETATEPRLVMGIKTLLNMMFIALQDKREKNQNDLSKQNVSVTPPFVKGKKLQVPSAWAQWIQKFENQIKMPLKGRS